MFHKHLFVPYKRNKTTHNSGQYSGSLNVVCQVKVCNTTYRNHRTPQFSSVPPFSARMASYIPVNRSKQTSAPASNLSPTSHSLNESNCRAARTSDGGEFCYCFTCVGLGQNGIIISTKNDIILSCLFITHSTHGITEENSDRPHYTRTGFKLGTSTIYFAAQNGSVGRLKRGSGSKGSISTGGMDSACDTSECCIWFNRPRT
jgi:hypothetical protein